MTSFTSSAIGIAVTDRQVLFVAVLTGYMHAAKNAFQGIGSVVYRLKS